MLTPIDVGINFNDAIIEINSKSNLKTGRQQFFLYLFSDNVEIEYNFKKHPVFEDKYY